MRRTKNKIRQQTAPFGIMYHTPAPVLSGNLKSDDVPNLHAAFVVLEECNMVHAPSARDTVESMDRPVSTCASAVIDVLGTYSAPKVDSIGDSSSVSGKRIWIS
jgi:hypothetical protein